MDDADDEDQEDYESGVAQYWVESPEELGLAERDLSREAGDFRRMEKLFCTRCI